MPVYPFLEIGRTEIMNGYNQIVACRSPDGLGRVVQVRKRRGQFGSDQIFIRNPNGELNPWENQGVFSIKDEFLNLYEDLFTDTYLDVPDTEYTIVGKEPETGFIIPDTGEKYDSTIPDTSFSIVTSKDSLTITTLEDQMSWANCGTDSNGRSIGYAHEAICDHPECNTKIDRGLSYACGGMHGSSLPNGADCEGYFCSDHLIYTDIEGQDRGAFLCPKCSKALEE